MLSGCGEVWYRAWFGTKRPRVQIPTLRPKKHDRLDSNGIQTTVLLLFAKNPCDARLLAIFGRYREKMTIKLKC